MIVSTEAVTASDNGIATTPMFPTKSAIITPRVASWALFVSRGVRVSRKAISPRVTTSVPT